MHSSWDKLGIIVLQAMAGLTKHWLHSYLSQSTRKAYRIRGRVISRNLPATLMAIEAL